MYNEEAAIGETLREIRALFREQGDLLEKVADNGVQQVAIILLEEIPLDVPDQISSYRVAQRGTFLFELETNGGAGPKRGSEGISLPQGP